MSKDIRSYFSNSAGISKRNSKAESVSPQNKKRRRRVIESDDEDDLVFIKKTKDSDSSSKPKTKEKKPEVVVQVENFFGSTPVLQKKQTTIPAKKDDNDKKKVSPKKTNKSKKKENKNKKIESGDLMFENDDELEASLLQTDDEKLISSLSSSGKNNSSEPVKRENKTELKPNIVGDNVTKKTPEKKNNGEANQFPQKDVSLDSEKKKKNAEAYQRYLNRSGPKNPGSKEIPKGTPTCLQGLTFVITGVLDSLERDEAVELIQKCGGRVVSQVSKKTDFIVVGEECGVSKIQKAEKFGTKKLNEDELLNLIQDKSTNESVKKTNCTPEKTSSYFDSNKKKRKKEDDKEVQTKLKVPKKEEEKNIEDFKVTNASKLNKSTKSSPTKPQPFIPSSTKVSPKKTQSSIPSSIKVSPSKSQLSITTSTSQKSGETFNTEVDRSHGDVLWVDKYKPKSTKNIIGQTGEKSNVKKLMKWLENWHKNHSSKGNTKHTRPAPWAQNDDGSYFKAALLSGPPGVGKTTTVHLVCEELGLDIVEFNASDTRSKRLLQKDVSGLLSTKSIRGFLQDSGESYKKHVLVMDEVDGMAGNEDRGGIQELIQLIKNTKIPIVGICNDRSHPKMRSLVNYCFDLRFHRPRVEQIKAAMKSICFKEKIDISGEALQELIVSSNHDVRQVLHNLSTLASGDKTLSLEEAKIKGKQAKKPLNLSPWDVARKVFSASEQKEMSFMDKSDLFFQDYSMGPLFAQDIYLRVKPYNARDSEREKLELIAKAAESFALGDIVEKTIRNQNAWNLLPVQAIFSSVMPGHYMSGHVQGQIQFPVWFGKNSKRNKLERLLQELHSSLRCSVTGTKGSINLDYLNYLKNSILRPLLKDGAQGVPETVSFMVQYQLTREDLDFILELSSWPGFKDPFAQVDSRVKTALTKALNKECQLVSHTVKKHTQKKDSEYDIEDVEEELNDEENDDVELDPMIKKAKPKKANKEETTSKNKSTKKGKEKTTK